MVSHTKEFAFLSERVELIWVCKDPMKGKIKSLSINFKRERQWQRLRENEFPGDMFWQVWAGHTNILHSCLTSKSAIGLGPPMHLTGLTKPSGPSSHSQQLESTERALQYPSFMEPQEEPQCLQQEPTQLSPNLEFTCCLCVCFLLECFCFLSTLE